MNSDSLTEENTNLWLLVDEMEKLYKTREYGIPQVADKFGISRNAARKTFSELNYHHTLKRTPETSVNGKLVNGIHAPEDFSFLLKYVRTTKVVK